MRPKAAFDRGFWVFTPLFSQVPGGPAQRVGSGLGCRERAPLGDTHPRNAERTAHAASFPERELLLGRAHVIILALARSCSRSKSRYPVAKPRPIAFPSPHSPSEECSARSRFRTRRFPPCTANSPSKMAKSVIGTWVRPKEAISRTAHRSATPFHSNEETGSGWVNINWH